MTLKNLWSWVDGDSVVERMAAASTSGWRSGQAGGSTRRGGFCPEATGLHHKPKLPSLQYFSATATFSKLSGQKLVAWTLSLGESRVPADIAQDWSQSLLYFVSHESHSQACSANIPRDGQQRCLLFTPDFRNIIEKYTRPGDCWRPNLFYIWSTPLTNCSM